MKPRLSFANLGHTDNNASLMLGAIKSRNKEEIFKFIDRNGSNSSLMKIMNIIGDDLERSDVKFALEAMREFPKWEASQWEDVKYEDLDGSMKLDQ